MNVLSAILNRFRSEPAEAKIDLASFNPLGREAAEERTQEEESTAEKIKAEIKEFITEIDQTYHQHRQKHLHQKISDNDARALIDALPVVDFGENKKHLTLHDQAFLTEEKHTLIMPLLDHLGHIRKYGQEQIISKAEYVDLKKVLFDTLMRLFSSPSQIPTFDWTVAQLKELDMIPNYFTFRHMEKYCALGRWG